MAPSIGDSLHKMISSDERDYAAREVAPVGSLPGTIRRKRRVRVAGTSLATVAAVGAIALAAPYLSPAPIDPAGPAESGQKYTEINSSSVRGIMPVTWGEGCGQPAPTPSMGEDGLFISVVDAPASVDLSAQRDREDEPGPGTATIRLANDRATPTSALYTYPLLVFTQDGAVVSYESSSTSSVPDYDWISLERGDLTELSADLTNVASCYEPRDEFGSPTPLTKGDYEVYVVVTVSGGQGPAAARSLLEQGVDPGSFTDPDFYSQGSWDCRRSASYRSNPDNAELDFFFTPAECVEGTDYDPETGSIAVTYPPEYYADEFKVRLVSEPFTVSLTGEAPPPEQYEETYPGDDPATLDLAALAFAPPQCGAVVPAINAGSMIQQVWDDLSISRAAGNRHVKDALAKGELSIGFASRWGGFGEQEATSIALNGEATIVVFTRDPAAGTYYWFESPLTVVATGTAQWGAEREYALDSFAGPTFIPIKTQDFYWCPGAETDEDLYLFIAGEATFVRGSGDDAVRTTEYIGGHVSAE